MKDQVTIKDIARYLGLSVSTVSRALRGMHDVNPETRVAVEELAAQLNYQPNLIARNQVKKQTFNLGVIIPSFTIYFYSQAISGIQEAALAAGYKVMICQTNESYEAEVNNLETLISSRIDGLLISLSKETNQYDHLLKLKTKGLPVVLFNRVCDLEFSKVVVDDYKGAYKLTKHLLAIGCKRIAHISGPKQLLISQNRLRGYLDALNSENIKIDEDLIIECDFTTESGKECTKHLLQFGKKPDGIFAVCDSAAFGVIDELKENNIKIPDDIAVGGFTNEPFSKLIDPKLTTVAQPIFDIGRNAAKMVIEHIENYKTANQTKILDTELIIRESTLKLK